MTRLRLVVLIPIAQKRPLRVFQKSEKEGFEPSRQITPPNTLAGCRLQPTRPLFQKRKLILSKKSFFYKLFIKTQSS